MLILSQAVCGQDAKLSKTEKKALIKEAKSYKSNPEKLRDLKNEMSSLKLKVINQEENLRLLANESENQKTQISSYENQLNQLKNELDKEKASNLVISKTPKIERGLSFRVQIGGYVKRDLAAYSDSEERFLKVEKNNIGVQEITLGLFTNYREADEFKKHLRAMGLKDAWIVPYKDGKRVLLKDVLGEIDLKN